MSAGEVAERPKAAVLKTVVGKLTGGSNPSLSASYAPTIVYGEMAERLKAHPC